MQPLEKVEMTGGVDAAGYGKSAGYSEDYSQPAAAETCLTDPPAYEEAGEWTNGGGAAAAEAQAAPANPFTQQAYNTQSSNPFRK